MATDTRKRKIRSDSIKFQATVLKDAIAGKAPPPGFKLSKQERVFWDAIIAARAEWTQIDLIHAVSLAETLADRYKNRAMLKKEGYLIKAKNGATIVNPRLRLIKEATQLSISLSVKLQIHATATIGDSDEQVSKNRAKRLATEAVNGEFDDDEGLIARPKH